MSVSIDVAAAVSFVATHGRVLDRRRLALMLGTGSPEALLAAVHGYRNEDGGYGWGLEPDLRSPESQPAGAMHAFEVMAEAGPIASAQALALCDWLQGQTLADGGLPFVLPVTDSAGNAPWWTSDEPPSSSLQTTAQVAANGLVVARHDGRIASHPWLSLATNWCLEAIRRVDTVPHAYELLFAVRFLDAVIDVRPEVAGLLDRLGAFIPASGVMPVSGGTEDEGIRALDFAPLPGRPARRLFSTALIDDELERLARGQQPDGGWTVEFASSSPVAALEWRGYMTVQAVRVLRAAGRA